MIKGYLTRRPIKQIQDNFVKKGFTNVDQFIKDNFREDVSLERNGSTFTPYTSIDKQNLIYMDDRGNGRISNGLRALEAITKMLKSVSVNSLVLFDHEIYNIPYNFRNMSITETRKVIIDNLGMTTFIQAALIVSKDSVERLYKMSDLMTKDIKNGTFSFEKYLNQALATCKAVVVASSNYRVK